jgi:hypothetical protein
MRRFDDFSVVEDLNGAIEAFQSILNVDHLDIPRKIWILYFLGTTLECRFDCNQNGYDLDQALVMYEEAISSAPEMSRNYALYLDSLATVLYKSLKGQRR